MGEEKHTLEMHVYMLDPPNSWLYKLSSDVHDVSPPTDRNLASEDAHVRILGVATWPSRGSHNYRPIS